jgi:C-terminal processing protease CtpA/Prc
MLLNIAAVRHTFPDGSQFEGIGVAPDIETQTTAEDLKASRDVVLTRAGSNDSMKVKPLRWRALGDDFRTLLEEFLINSSQLVVPDRLVSPP